MSHLCLYCVEIVFPAPVVNEDALTLKNMCPMNVFDIEDIRGVPTATVGRVRDCTMCRECIRHEGWNEKVLLRRVADHFIFTVESSGCMPPEDIVREVHTYKQANKQPIVIIHTYIHTYIHSFIHTITESLFL